MVSVTELLQPFCCVPFILAKLLIFQSDFQPHCTEESISTKSHHSQKVIMSVSRSSVKDIVSEWVLLRKLENCLMSFRFQWKASLAPEEWDILLPNSTTGERNKFLSRIPERWMDWDPSVLPTEKHFTAMIKRVLSKPNEPVVCIFILVCLILTALFSPFLANFNQDCRHGPMTTSQVCPS